MCGIMTTPSSPSKRFSVSDHNDVLACHICLEVYDEHGHEAKFLSCHHSFCSACLKHLAAKTHDYIECPSCRAHTSLTEAGISGNAFLLDSHQRGPILLQDGKTCSLHTHDRRRNTPEDIF